MTKVRAMRRESCSHDRRQGHCSSLSEKIWLSGPILPFGVGRQESVLSADTWDWRSLKRGLLNLHGRFSVGEKSLDASFSLLFVMRL